MSAHRALDAARAAGLQVQVDGKDLIIVTVGDAAPDVIDMLRRHKLSIVALLQQELRQKHLLHLVHPWGPDDWRAFFDERAGIAEFDGALGRAEAEMRAFDCCVAEWLLGNPINSSPDQCLQCRKPAGVDDPLLAIGVVGAGEAWLHCGCVPAWHSARRDTAITALSAMNITASAGGDASTDAAVTN